MRGLGHILQIHYIPSFENFIKFMIESAATWPSTIFFFCYLWSVLQGSFRFLSFFICITDIGWLSLSTNSLTFVETEGCLNLSTLLYKCLQKFTSAAACCLDKSSLLQIFILSTFSSSQPADVLLLLLLVLLVTWYFEFAKLCGLRTLVPYLSYAPYLRALRGLSTCLKIFLGWICTSPKIPIFPRTVVLQTMLF